MYTLGIDLGTTFTAAATWRNGHAETQSLGSRTAAIPSVVFLKEDETFLTGEAATRRGLIEPNRLAREFKRRLGDTTPIMLGGAPYSAEALLAQLLRTVVDEVTRREGASPRLPACRTRPTGVTTRPTCCSRRCAWPGSRSRCRSRRSPRPRPSSTPNSSGSTRARSSRSTTWAAAPSTRPCCERQRSGSRSWADRRASSASAGSTSTRPCSATSAGPLARSSANWTRTTPVLSPPSPGCGTSASRQRRPCPRTRTWRSPSCYPT